MLSILCSMAIILTSLGIASVISAETEKESVPFINSYSITSPLRNDFDNFIGMKITVGSKAIKITSLGRMFFAGNTQSHLLKLVDAETKADVEGASTTIQGGSEGAFTYADLAAPVTLASNHSYYLVSKENIGGDNFAEGTTQVTTATDASCSGFVFCIDGTYNDGNYPGSTFVLLNFKYEVEKVDVVDKAALVTGAILTNLRNDFGNWIGTKITIADKDIAVTELGRIFVAGNTQAHLVKIADAQTKADVPGAVAFVQGGTSGAFTYSPLSKPVILKANQSYYIVSLEYYLGDRFGEGDTTITTTSAAACNGRVFCIDGVYSESIDAGYSYVPVSLKYGFVAPPQSDSKSGSESQDPTPTPVIDESELIKEVNIGSLRNNFSSWVGMKTTIGKEDVKVTSLGRLFLNGNTQTHDIKIVDAATGLDIPGASIKISGGTDKQFTYARLQQPVTLGAGKTYYIMSLEYMNGDSWCDGDSSVITSAAAGCGGWVYYADNKYTEGNFPGYSFGLVSLKYEKKQAIVPKSLKKLITTSNFGVLRNDFNSWVGMRITVSSKPLVIASIGRMFVSGNTQAHKLKIVDAATGIDVPGSVVTVTGGTNKNFTYKDLDEPITLEAGKKYYVMSYEYANGDQWYDADSTIATTSAATCDGWAFYLPDTGYNFGDFPTHSFAILDLKYSINSTNPTTSDDGLNYFALCGLCFVIICITRVTLVRRKIHD